MTTTTPTTTATTIVVETSGTPGPTSVAMRFEVTTIPVADVDRAKAFYLGLGWQLDADINFDAQTRVVQVTPIGSPASIQFGTPRAPGAGTVHSLYLTVGDIEAARADLVGRGADVSEIWHRGPGGANLPGVDPDRTSYNSFATFTDPDGNGWLVQELNERLPGRVRLLDTPGLAARLYETSLRHATFEAAAPPHHWWDWYAAYMDARDHGAGEDQASTLANTYMAEVKGVVLPTPAK